MKKLINFGDLSEKQISDLSDVAQKALVEYSEKHFPTYGFSGGTTFNIYSAIDQAIHQEWEKAKKSYANSK